MSTYDSTALQAAAAALAGVCDYAQDLDGRGYNGVDTHLGHMLSEYPAGLWDDDTALTAWDMLRKYKAQLAGMGITWDAIERPPGAEELEEERRQAARARAKERAKAWRHAEQIKKDSWVACEGPGETVILHFAWYDPQLVAGAKNIPGRSYDGRDNEFPFAALPQVIDLAGEHGINVPPEVRALIPAVAEMTKAAQNPAEIYIQAGRIIVKTGMNDDMDIEFRIMNGGKSTWDYYDRVHRLPKGTSLHVAADIAARYNLRAVPEIQEAMRVQDLNRAESSAETAPPVDIPGLAPGESLLPQQYPVVRFTLRNRGVLVGDEMGLGKTLSAAASVAAAGKLPVIIACPPALTLNWEKELARFFPSWKVHVASGQTPVPPPPGTGAVIIGTAALGYVDEDATKQVREQNPNAPQVFPWIPVLAAIRPQAMILDEGHEAKEIKANRSQALLQLAKQIHAVDGMTLDLTGTAIINRVGELIHQLKIIGRWGDFGCDEKTFKRRYRQQENWLELHDQLRAWGIMVRRTDEILDLPPLHEQILPLCTEDLPPDMLARYKRAEKDVITYFADEAAEIAERLGTDPQDARVKTEMRLRSAEHLVRINALRQIVGEAKIDIVSRWIATKIMLGEKVMIVAHHQKVVDALSAKFGGLTIRGGQSVRSKEEHKRLFQEYPIELAPAITIAAKAGGVGHTLTAARIGIQVEPPWTPGDYRQPMKRQYRIGQTREVWYFRAIVKGTIDVQMDKLVHGEKQPTLDGVLDGKITEVKQDDDEQNAIAEIAWQLAQRGLAAEREPVLA